MNLKPIVTRRDGESGNTGQSGGLAFLTGVGGDRTPSQRLWFGRAKNAPGSRSLPHHHGEAATGAYLLSGRARIYFGDHFNEYPDLNAGGLHVRAAATDPPRS